MRDKSDQAVDLVDLAVDLGPVTAPALVVVARMPHVHCRGGEYGVAGNELVELVLMHTARSTNACSLNQTRVGRLELRPALVPRSSRESGHLAGILGQRRSRL